MLGLGLFFVICAGPWLWKIMSLSSGKRWRYRFCGNSLPFSFHFLFFALFLELLLFDVGTSGLFLQFSYPFSLILIFLYFSTFRDILSIFYFMFPLLSSPPPFFLSCFSFSKALFCFLRCPLQVNSFLFLLYSSIVFLNSVY